MEERWSEIQYLRGREWVPRREAEAFADAADIYAVAIEAGDLRTPREKAAPYIANVAADAVARHEREHHLTLNQAGNLLTEVELLARKWVLSNDVTTRTLGADLIQVLRSEI